MLLKINDASLIYDSMDVVSKLLEIKSNAVRRITQRIHKGTQRMLKEPQNNIISYSKWKILTLYGPNSFFRRFSGHNLR